MGMTPSSTRSSRIHHGDDPRPRPHHLPAVLQVRLEWTTWFWLPAFLLEASLLVRIGIGDGLDRSAAVQAGGTVNVLSY